MKVITRRASTELKKFLNTLPTGKTFNKEQLIKTYKEYRKHGTHQEQDIPASFMSKVNDIRKRSEFRKVVVYIRNGKPTALPIETYMSWLKCASVAGAARTSNGNGKNRGSGKGWKHPNNWIKKLTKTERQALGRRGAAVAAANRKAREAKG